MADEEKGACELAEVLSDKIAFEKLVFFAKVRKRTRNGPQDILGGDAPVPHALELFAIAGKHVRRAYPARSCHLRSEVASGNHAVLEFLTVIDGISINGVDMITWGEDGRITDFKVMLRPLKAVNLVHKMMGEMLQKIK